MILECWNMVSRQQYEHIGLVKARCNCMLDRLDTAQHSHVSKSRQG